MIIHSAEIFSVFTLLKHPKKSVSSLKGISLQLVKVFQYFLNFSSLEKYLLLRKSEKRIS